MINDGDAQVSRTGVCELFGLDDRLFSLEPDDEEAAQAWFDFGNLEVGATETVFLEGGVILLATGTRDAAGFADLYAPLE